MIFSSNRELRIYVPQFFIGQIEGGFVFSLGFWMQEQIKHDPTTGQLLTNDTWVRHK